MLQFLLLFLLLFPLAAQDGPGVITTGQTITPAGVQSVFRGRVYGVTFGASASEIWVLTATEISHFDWKANRTIERIAIDGTAGLQGVLYDPAGKRVLASGV